MYLVENIVVCQWCRYTQLVDDVHKSSQLRMATLYYHKEDAKNQKTYWCEAKWKLNSCLRIVSKEHIE